MYPVRNPQQSPKAYNGHYNRGWATSERGTEGALDRADGRGENDAWYDGYMDSATGREKWHLRECPDHENCG